MIPYTNGYLVRILEKAANDVNHEDHGEADQCLKAFRKMETTFFDEVHPTVDMGLAISETQIADGGILDIYTIHGSRHISDVIKSLDKLAKSLERYSLSVSEAYILLCAAHIHDAANAKKRKDHPSRCNTILQRYKNLYVSSAAIQHIYDVARVHGGEHESFGKDTLRSLDDNVNPHLRLLASLLRLGDELSENAERVPKNVIEHHEPSARSRLAYAYAESFALFSINNEALSISYNIYPSARNLIVTLDDGPQSFLDYLEHKIDVIEREARYCSQYGRPFLSITIIKVTIRNYRGEMPSEHDPEITFDLNLNHGYFDTTHPLCVRSPQLRERSISRLSEAFNKHR